MIPFTNGPPTFPKLPSMPLTLEQYACEYLPTRPLPWPAAPKVEPPKARPHLERLPVRAVLWNVYGTLLAVPGAALQFENQHEFVTDAAFEKTITEFNMWNSMVRRPGPPGPQLREQYRKLLTNLQMAGGAGEKFPEVLAERPWDEILKRLQQREYQYDAGKFGPPAEYVKKIAYFYHASIQGVGAYPGAADAVRMAADVGAVNGLLADGQCFTPAQLQKAFREQDPGFDVALSFPAPLRVLSFDKKARKPSDALFRAAVEALAGRGIRPSEALHVGSDVARDIGPAKRHGLRTALFAGDKGSLAATADQLKDPALRPDVMLTELPQIVDVIG